MNLHNNTKLFSQIIKDIASNIHLDESIIEKDYYVTLVLKELIASDYNFIFKGGTNLSKCFHIINRFSEDIDISYKDNSLLTQGKRKRIKYGLKDICDKYNLKIINFENTRSRCTYNKYEIDYNQKFTRNSPIKDYVLVEIVFLEESYPIIEVEANSIIGEWLLKYNKLDVIEKYELKPFKLQTHSLARTFVDKIFAICDYHISGKITGHSRHLYDLYKIKNSIKFDDDFFSLLNKVKNERKKNKKSYSAQDNISYINILKDIINKNAYKADFEENTKQILYEKVTYEMLINNLKNIVNILSASENN